MVYKVMYHESAERDLELLPENDAKRIVNKLAFYEHSRDPLRYARRLKNFESPTYRFRIGDYRAIFRLDPQTRQVVILLILQIAHRKEAYR